MLVTQSCPTLCHPMDCYPPGSKQEYWSGWLFHSPGDLPDPRIKPRSPALQADSLRSEPPGKPRATKALLSSPNPTSNLRMSTFMKSVGLHSTSWAIKECTVPQELENHLRAKIRVEAILAFSHQSTHSFIDFSHVKIYFSCKLFSP